MERTTQPRVLVACEFSGVVREAFAAIGADAWSCDTLPTEVPGKHIQADVRYLNPSDWDLVIAHPPCTYLCVTGNKWMGEKYRKRFPTRQVDREIAIDLFMHFTRFRRYAIENPIGIMSTLWRKPDQIIHPYYFGDPHSKATCLWLKGVPPLKRTRTDVVPAFYTYKDGRRDPVWHVETMKLPAAERMKARSRTFPGIAAAMAAQWGELL